ncbi:MAG: beta-ketoacyl-ACP synthase 3, partial [Bdellovibrionales bacterium]|nr:beta-ketoacyl-ACP synthase 3 [Bdellovibrionales bacterium]
MNNLLSLADAPPSQADFPLRSRISGTGAALPSKKLTNSDLAKFLDTSDEWILDRVGIESRYICGENESCVSLASRASKDALEAAGVSPEQIELVIFATVTPDQLLPSAAALLAADLGIPSALAFDIHAACSGFIFSLGTAESLMKSMGFSRALVVGAEALSRMIDWNDRNTAVLFGDGAGACVLEINPKSSQTFILGSYLRTDASGAHLIERSGGAFPKPVSPASSYVADVGSAYVTLQGREVFKSGVGLMTHSIREVLKSAKLSINDVSLFIPHQSNKRMIQSVCNQIGLDDESRIGTNIAEIGNTSAASIPIVLD